MSQFITTSREETVALGRRLAAALPDGSLIAFTGGLGAGKTAFCEGLAEGLGCTDPVSSPTFAIVNYYRGPRPFAHFDLYRISTENDLCAAGFYDYLDQGAIVAAEWSENFADLLALENKLSRAQRQLGALVYALHKNGEENTALVERYIETIAAVEKDIAALEPAPAAAMADDAQTAVYCPQCGAEVDPHAIFCPGCGGKL